MPVRSYEQIFVGGNWCDPSTDDRIEVVSPHTEDVIAYAAAGSAQPMSMWRFAPRERLSTTARGRG